MRASALFLVSLATVACTATTTPNPNAPDLGFDGTCINCHTGMSAGHTHPSYKLRCIDCHGGNDQVAVGSDAATQPAHTPGGYDDPSLFGMAHVAVKNKSLTRFFLADGLEDESAANNLGGPQFDDLKNPTKVTNLGVIFEPGVHGEGPGEFVDDELNRDLNYTRFMNPGDLRVATIGCGGMNRAALDGGFGCHQEVVDTVRRSIMVNQSAVTNGAYYGNESWRAAFQMFRGNTPDPRAGAFAYSLDYAGADACIDLSGVQNDPQQKGGRGQPKFNSAMCESTASMDPSVAAGAPGNVGQPPFEIKASAIAPASGVAAATTPAQTGATTADRLPWGNQPVLDTTAERATLSTIPKDVVPGTPFPDPVDVVLRTFRAYYPLNYPGSTVNFANGTFGSSILPEVATNVVNNPFGRGHSSGCSACHAPYRYDGARNPTVILNDDGSTTPVTDPTTKPREFDPATQDRATIVNDSDPNALAHCPTAGVACDQLIGRAVNLNQRQVTGRVQQRTYSADHQLTTHVDTDTCGLCHGFVTRINYAYQGMAEDEQRDQGARRKPIAWTTPAGTQVVINDSWVRQDFDPATKTLGTVHAGDDAGVALDTIKNAVARDQALAQHGFIPGNGGCAAATFTEDCNNNGELDHALVLQKLDDSGNVVDTAMLDEDGTLSFSDGTSVKAGNGNGKLDLIDHLPRERSVDGRQMHYIYGGRNGSTRQMDIHFEKGMHCIDCHFLQDVHGDGHVYSTNWDHIEIECEDCHGASKRATLKTSGPNGNNDLTTAVNENLEPFFENRGGKIIQRSRVTPGLSWEVPQTVDEDAKNPYAKEAHHPSMNPTAHLAEPRSGIYDGTSGSTFSGTADGMTGLGTGALQSAKLECATCHSSWIHNCLGCHIDLNIGDKQRKFTIQSDLSTVQASAGENEIWFSNAQCCGPGGAIPPANPAHVNFQLLGLMRAPFVLGTSSSSEGGRLAPFRSSMQALVTITDQNGNTIRDNLTFTTFQAVDRNSGRANVATSAVAMNQTMPHTVRPSESRGCETCHPLVDTKGRLRNEHILAETYGLGTGAYPYVGDWAMAAGTAINNVGSAIELYDYKKERELANNAATDVSRFPGMIINAADRVAAKVEPTYDGSANTTVGATANDIVLVRNFNPTPAMAGQTVPPTLTDLAVLAVDNNGGGLGRIIITDISARGNPGVTRPSIGDANTSFVLLRNGTAPRALAHVGSDVSDPFVYVASANVGSGGGTIDVIHLDGAPSASAAAASLLRSVTLDGGRTPRALALAGDVLYVGTDEGTIDTFDLSDPTTPVSKASLDVGAAVQSVATRGFLLVAGTSGGLAILALDQPLAPATLPGSPRAIVAPGVNAINLSVSNGHVYVAAGAAGVLDVDIRTAANPAAPVNLSAALAPGQPINAVDVIVSKMPGQTWLLVLDANGDLWGLKLDNRQSLREKCFPDPVMSGCVLDPEFNDPTILGRDPSVLADGTFDPTDPSAGTNVGGVIQPFFHQTHTLLSAGKRLARPSLWEQIGTLTGRRVRDSFMPGSGVLSLPVMQAMRSIQLCESTATSTTPGNLGQLGYADATFLGGGACTPFATSMMRATGGGKLAPVCRRGDPPIWK